MELVIVGWFEGAEGIDAFSSDVGTVPPQLLATFQAVLVVPVQVLVVAPAYTSTKLKHITSVSNNKKVKYFFI